MKCEFCRTALTIEAAIISALDARPNANAITICRRCSDLLERHRIFWKTLVAKE